MKIVRKMLGLLVLLGAWGVNSMPQAWAQGSDFDGPRLEGTWLFTVSLKDCSLGTPIGAPFLSLLTFARGGTMTETAANAMFFPGVRSPGHGVWKVAEQHSFKAITMAFITVNGVLTRTQTIEQTIEVEGENLAKTTSASVTFRAPDGTVLTTGCAAATGKRIELEPGS